MRADQRRGDGQRVGASTVLPEKPPPWLQPTWATPGRRLPAVLPPRGGLCRLARAQAVLAPEPGGCKESCFSSCCFPKQLAGSLPAAASRDPRQRPRRAPRAPTCSRTTCEGERRHCLPPRHVGAGRRAPARCGVFAAPAGRQGPACAGMAKRTQRGIFGQPRAARRGVWGHGGPRSAPERG